jgi:glycosyltransferase involved in cell wall biosynthesis
VNGFIVHNVEDGAAAVGNLAQLDRAGCRQRFEQRFTAQRMTQDYVAVYERLVGLRPRLLAKTAGVPVV